MTIILSAGAVIAIAAVLLERDLAACLIMAAAIGVYAYI